MQVRRETVASAVVDPVVAVLGVVGAAEGGEDKTIHRVIDATTHGATGLVEVEVAEGQRPAPDIEFLEVLQGWQDLARILVEGFLDFPGGNFESFIPGDGLPLGVHTGPFLGVGAAHGLLESRRVVMSHNRGIPFRAELAIVGRIGGVPFDLVDDSLVRHVDEVATGVQAHLAGGSYPATTFQGIRRGGCVSHTQVLAVVESLHGVCTGYNFYI